MREKERERNRGESAGTRGREPGSARKTIIREQDGRAIIISIYNSGSQIIISRSSLQN